MNISCSDYSAIITGSFTIIGIIVGGVFARFTTLSAIKRQEFIRASSEFMAAFTETLYKLHPKNTKSTAQDIVELAMPAHEIAKTKFRPYLEMAESRKIAALDKAWEKYCHKKDDMDFPDAPYLAYRDITYTPGGEIEMKQLAKCRIEKLLEFAKF